MNDLVNLRHLDASLKSRQEKIKTANVSQHFDRKTINN